ncbi:MAG: hypothetical protein CMH56_05330 [Myxococcales bacterium]|nr:hypothetical protein [Myxococcales bacterium]
MISQCSPGYVLLVFLFSRMCFWGLALFQDVSFFDGMCVWDCHWYSQLATQGYDTHTHSNMANDAANWPFFPAFPFLMHLVQSVIPFSMKIIGVLLANVCMYFAILVSLRYLQKTREHPAKHFWVWLCCLGPFSFYFASGYSESLFWFLGCLAMLLWQHQNYIRAGCIAALLTATRFFGIFWPIAWGIELFCLMQFHAFKHLSQNPKKLFALCLGPLGLFCFIFYLYHHMGDGLAFVYAQKAWGRSNVPFWQDLQYSLQFWTDFGPLLNPEPATRYSFAFFNYIAIMGGFFSVWLASQKRFFEAAVALMLMVTVIKSGIIGVPRYMAGVPVFAFAFHDVANRFLPPLLRILLLAILFLFNFWLLSNWYDSAFFLV